MKNVSPLPQKYGAAKLFSALIMMFFEHQINILEWFLKDHMTLKFQNNNNNNKNIVRLKLYITQNDQ